MISIFTTAILARLLTEEDFGLVAITILVVTMFDVITSVGLGAAVIRRDSIDDDEVSTFFWASVALGTCAGLLVVAVSTPAAILAGDRAAAPLVALAALTLPLSLASRIPSGLLVRSLRFRPVALVDIIGSIVHAAVAISLAQLGLGALAVVIGHVSRSAVILVGSLGASRFRPLWRFRRRALIEEMSFSLNILGADIVWYGNKNADYWFVGNRLGSAQLGIYYISFLIPTLLRWRLTRIGHDVLYPVISKIQDDKPRIVAAYLRVLHLMAFLMFPAMLGLAIVADLVIQVGFGPDWEAAIEPLRIIALGTAFASMSTVAHPIFPALGVPGLMVRTGVISLITLVVGLAFSYSNGNLSRVALAVVIAAAVGAVTVQVYTKQLIGVTHLRFLTSVFPYLASSLLMLPIVWAARRYPFGELNGSLQLLALPPIGAVAYLAAGLLWFRGAFGDQIRAVKDILTKKK